VTRVPLSLLMLLCLTALPAQAGQARAETDTVRLIGDRQEVLLDMNGGLPARWLACATDCASALAHQTMVFLRVTTGGGRLAWSLPGDPAGEEALAALRYTAVVRPVGGEQAVILTSLEPWRGMRLVHRYRLRADGAGLVAEIQVPPGATLRLSAGSDLRPEQLPGLGAWYSRVRAVAVTAAGQAEAGEGADLQLVAGNWAGVRSRFWAMLVRADEPLNVRTVAPGAGIPAVVLGEASSTGRTRRLDFYAGPVELGALRAVEPQLDALLFAALWNWLRALSFGLLALLGWWHGLVGNWGVAIILLSLSVKVLMAPLTWLAERWQAQVNRVQSRLQPELSAIKAAYKGEEAHERTLAVYRDHGVSPYYTFKSLAGFLIQIPVFVAAFDMLGENFMLAGSAFLWMPDLSMPDRLAALPVAVPFFGSHLNLLPILMTACTILAARLQEEPSLSPALRASQRLRLYAMAALFFVLLYTFPSAMVLYWTTNNVLHLLRVLTVRRADASCA